MCVCIIISTGNIWPLCWESQQRGQAPYRLKYPRRAPSETRHAALSREMILGGRHSPSCGATKMLVYLTPASKADCPAYIPWSITGGSSLAYLRSSTNVSSACPAEPLCSIRDFARERFHQARISSRSLPLMSAFSWGFWILSDLLSTSPHRPLTGHKERFCGSFSKGGNYATI